MGFIEMLRAPECLGLARFSLARLGLARFSLAGAALAALGVGALPVAAQENGAGRIANGARFGNWVINCEAVAVNETACVLTQRLIRTADNAFLADLLAFTSPDGSRNFIAARVPTGVYFPGGFAMKPEGAEGDDQNTVFVWQSCGPNLCEALVEIDGAALTALEEAEAVVAGYRPNRLSDPLVFRLGFGGLREGLDALAAAKGGQ